MREARGGQDASPDAAVPSGWLTMLTPKPATTNGAPSALSAFEQDAGGLGPRPCRSLGHLSATARALVDAMPGGGRAPRRASAQRRATKRESATMRRRRRIGEQQRRRRGCPRAMTQCAAVAAPARVLRVGDQPERPRLALPAPARSARRWSSRCVGTCSMPMAGRGGARAERSITRTGFRPPGGRGWRAARRR